MKALILLLFLTIGLGSLNAQDRVEVTGQLSVSSSMSAEGITVFNVSSSKGTVTDSYGKFKIDVAENDLLEFSSVQFSVFTIIIDKGVINTETISIKVVPSVNTLEEVFIRPYDLSGNFEVDINYIETNAGAVFDINSLDAVYGYNYEFTDTPESAVDNVALKSLSLQNGANIANIIRKVFKKKKTDKNLPPQGFYDMDVELRKQFNDSFFTTQLNIPLKEINNFIFYAEDNGLTIKLIKSPKKLELIQFLLDTSKAYPKSYD